MIDAEEGQNLEVLGENEDSAKSMVPSKDQNLVKPRNQTKVWWPKAVIIYHIRPKKQKTTKQRRKCSGRETTSCWMSPPNCKINMTEFLEKAKSYTHLVTADGFLAIPEELQKIERRIVLAFVC